MIENGSEGAAIGTRRSAASSDTTGRCVQPEPLGNRSESSENSQVTSTMYLWVAANLQTSITAEPTISPAHFTISTARFVPYQHNVRFEIERPIIHPPPVRRNDRPQKPSTLPHKTTASIRKAPSGRPRPCVPKTVKFFSKYSATEGKFQQHLGLVEDVLEGKVSQQR
ncbi:hypothetical protein TIFTF001_003316 [Ficus carica]|uniref:Uncharacterized protein n=1 Tax=Ficus carica TaxID=3494 RepID=A0AA87ZEJ1_FICCA|nr:hypothetical protein TIFTF001_003316 [Ficus carica]